MGKFIDSMAEQFGGGIVGGILGLGMAGINDDRQIRQQRRLNELSMQQSMGLMDYQTKKQLEMWEKTNYPAQVEQLKKAGLNPGLLYGMSGGGGTTTGGGIPTVGSASAPAGGREIMDMMNMKLQMKMTEAQIKVMESQAEKNKAETAKTSGVDTQEALSRIELNSLESVIKKYTGMDIKDVYERIKSPNRSIEAKTYQDELEARQGIAGTIYELWHDGKLYEKGVQEIENLLLQGEKTRAEKMEIYKRMEILEENLKGAKLDNIIKELETKLQTETGIDRNSPAWMKVLGRLFVTLFNK